MRFSIITVSLNAETLIKRTLSSILKQSFSDYEIIIKDGMSIDQTIQYIPDDTRIKVYVKPDNGIYDAMNQAIDKSSGDYLIFMNCGDTFNNDFILEIINEKILFHNSPDILYGNYVSNGMLCSQPRNLTKFYLYRTPLCHQSMIIKKMLFETIGQYDLSFHILSDYNFTQKCWHSNKKFIYIDEIICQYLGGGISESPQGIKRKELERIDILKKYYNKKERFLYNLLLFFTFRRFRIWILNGNSPLWVKHYYRKIVNKINNSCI